MSITTSRRLINLISLSGFFALIVLAVYFYYLGIFDDIQKLQDFVSQAVLFGPLLFILIQIIQVIVPVIPGGISLAAGVLLFGPIRGFIYNYIGICLGSIILFWSGRQYGKPIVLRLVNEKTYNKYSHWLDNQKRFDRLFALAIFLPIAPDDALCLMASLTQISFKKFTCIILFAKPASVFLYSFILLYGGGHLIQFLL